jgi:hypothetical protein
MELKFKESIKLELIEKIKSEIVKRITDDILNEKSSLEFKEEINDYFFEKKESIFKSEEFIKMKEFVEKMDGNKLEKLYDGKLKEYFNFMLKGEKTPNVNNDYDSEEVANQIARDPLQTGVMFTEGIKKEFPKPNVIKNILDGSNLGIIVEKIRQAKTNDYITLEFSEETVSNLFKKLEENKENLNVTVEGKEEIMGTEKLSYSLYHVFSKDKHFFDYEKEVIDKDYLAFDLKVYSMSNIELQNLCLNGIKIPQGIISLKDAKKIYEIVCEIINPKPKETGDVVENIKEEKFNSETSGENSLEDKEIASTIDESKSEKLVDDKDSLSNQIDDVATETLKKLKKQKRKNEKNRF